MLEEGRLPTLQVTVPPYGVQAGTDKELYLEVKNLGPTPALLNTEQKAHSIKLFKYMEQKQDTSATSQPVDIIIEKIETVEGDWPTFAGPLLAPNETTTCRLTFNGRSPKEQIEDPYLDLHFHYNTLFDFPVADVYRVTWPKNAKRPTIIYRHKKPAPGDDQLVAFPEVRPSSLSKKLALNPKRSVHLYAAGFQLIDLRDDLAGHLEKHGCNVITKQEESTELQDEDHYVFILTDDYYTTPGGDILALHQHYLDAMKLCANQATNSPAKIYLHFFVQESLHADYKRWELIASKNLLALENSLLVLKNCQYARWCQRLMELRSPLTVGRSSAPCLHGGMTCQKLHECKLNIFSRILLKEMDNLQSDQP